MIWLKVADIHHDRPVQFRQKCLPRPTLSEDWTARYQAHVFNAHDWSCRRDLRDEPLLQPARVGLPRVYVEPTSVQAEGVTEQVEVPRAPAEWRKRNFAEVEVSLSPEEAERESQRCLRCDLEFTLPKGQESRESVA